MRNLDDLASADIDPFESPEDVARQLRETALALFTEGADVEEDEEAMRGKASALRDYVEYLDTAGVDSKVVGHLRRCADEIDDAARALRAAAAAYVTAGDLVDIAAQMAESGLRRWVTALHEAGHRVVADKLGYDVETTVITSADSGFCRVDTEGAPVEHVVAISHAGACACHSTGGCSADHAIRDAALATLPGGRQGSTRRDGERIAERTLRWNEGQVRRDAGRLFRRGRI